MRHLLLVRGDSYPSGHCRPCDAILATKMIARTNTNKLAHHVHWLAHEGHISTKTVIPQGTHSPLRGTFQLSKIAQRRRSTRASTPVGCACWDDHTRANGDDHRKAGGERIPLSRVEGSR